jgi:hypothetical protein
LSDSNGGWSEFFAGGECDELYSAVNPPIGYHPTTPVVVNECSAEFGFISDGSANTAYSIDVRQYLQERSVQEERNEDVALWLTLGISFILISVFAGFVTFKLIRPPTET